MLPRPSILRFLIGSALVMACSSSGTPTLTLQVQGSTSVKPGQVVTISLNASDNSSSGVGGTPLTGDVSLMATTGAGMLSSGSVTLNAEGSGMATFTVCTSGNACAPGSTVMIQGTLLANGKPATGEVTLTITTADQLVLSSSPSAGETVIAGQAVTVNVAACDPAVPLTLLPDAGAISCDGTPVTGNVTLTATGLTPVGATANSITVPLQANGTATASFTVNPGASGTVSVKGSLVLTSTISVSNTLTWSAQTSTPDAGGGTDAGVSSTDGGSTMNMGTTSVTSGQYALSILVTNIGSTSFGGRVPAGGSPLAVLATLTKGGVPDPTQSLQFAVTGNIGGLVPPLADGGMPAGPGATSLTAPTSSTGVAQLYFLSTSAATAAQGDITVAFTPPGASTIEATEAVSVVIPGAILAQAPTTLVMGVKHSGYNEQDQFTFQVVDSNNNPYPTAPDGTPVIVSFQVPALGGAYVSPTQIATDSAGIATTTVYSGTTAGTLAVTASATICISSVAPTASAPCPQPITITVTSATVSVVGAKASSKNLAITCDHYSVPALWGNDCSSMSVDVSPTCTIVLSDRYNNVLGVSTQVTWLSEAGLFGPPSSTTAAVPGANPTSEPTLGQTSNIMTMKGSRLPEEVTPLSNEPFQVLTSTTTPANLCGGSRTANPRDGLVTFLAATQGEEGFIDLNDNGVWDPGETFYDEGEPYVDANDNNQWDPGEQYIDVNGNGVYDGPNGVWDANTTIWAQGHVVVTGEQYTLEWPSVASGWRINSQTWNEDLAAIVPIGESSVFTVLWQDANLNSPSPTYSSYATSLQMPANGNVIQQYPLAGLVDSLGQMSVVQPTTCTNAPGANPSLAVCAVLPSGSAQGLADGGFPTCTTNASCAPSEACVETGKTQSLADGGTQDELGCIPTCATNSDCPTDAACVSVGAGASICESQCYCTQTTAIGFDGVVTQQGQYSSPNMAPLSGSGDLVQSTLSEVVGGTTISTTNTRNVVWTAMGSGTNGNADGGAVTTTEGAYSLAMLLTQQNQAFTGRVAAGSSPLNVSLTLTQGGSPVQGAMLTLNATAGIGTVASPLADAGFPATGAYQTSITLTTDSKGEASAFFLPESTGAAVGDIVATFSDPATGVAVTSPQVVTVVVPERIVFTPTAGFSLIMGVKNSGYNEQNLFDFTIYDSTGAAYSAPGGALVNFSVTPLGGATLTPTAIYTNDSGQAVTTVSSGTSAGTLAVTATASITISPSTTITLSTTSSTVAVVGAKAYGRNFALTCQVEAVPALMDNDCTFMHLDISPECTAVIGDRYGNVLGVSQEVTWLSEAGLFGPPTVTTPATPGADPTQEPAIGRTSNTLRLLDAVLPEEVTPLSGEPSHVLSATSACGARTASPRDGLITLIASTQGEEGFIDLNDNGKWDPGETFFDEGEPYADSNDNNQWDPGEPYLDANGNGVYDGPNGMWDANTTIWTIGHLAVTDVPTLPAAWTVTVPSPGGVWPPGFTWLVPFGNFIDISVTMSDDNLNPPAPLYTTYGLASKATGDIQVSSPTYPDSFGQMDVSLPTSCTNQPSATSTVCAVAPTTNRGTGSGACPVSCSTATDCPSGSTCVNVAGCNQCLDDCYCQTQTRITFTGVPPITGQYEAPTLIKVNDAGMAINTVGEGDTVEVDALIENGQSGVTAQTLRFQDNRDVAWVDGGSPL